MKIIFKDSPPNKKNTKKIKIFIQKRINFFFKKKYKHIKIITSVNNPMLNENLINTVCKASTKYNTSYILKNSNQGSTPEKIINNKYKKINFFYSDNDNNKNLDLSISKINRYYIFNIFLKKFPNLYKIRIKDFYKLISKNKYANQLLTYFNNKKIKNIKKCPNCKCLHIQKIQNTLTPNVIGFLDNRNLYSNCLRCGYIFLNKQIDEKDLYIYYKKYTYPPVSKKKIKEIAKKPNAGNVNHFLNYKNIENEFKSKNKMNILDLGGGNGCFAFFIKKNFHHHIKIYDWNIDKNAKYYLNKNKINYSNGDIYKKLITDEKKNIRYDIITLWEVIEHLKIEKLKKILKICNNLLKDNGKIILSTPNYNASTCQLFDFWSMFPGEHISIFFKDFLIDMFKKYNFQCKKISHENVVFKYQNLWFDYYKKSKYSSLSSNAFILNEILKIKKLNLEINSVLKNNNIGSEIIMVFKKTS